MTQKRTEPTPKPGNANEFFDELRIQLRILEEMFGDPGLRDLRRTVPRHPAIKRFDRLNAYVENKTGITYPVEIDLLREIAAMFVDRLAWALSPTATDYWAYIPDEKMRAQVKSRIRRPDKFEDTVAELFYWGWLRQKGIKVSLVEDEGHPDIIIESGNDGRRWAEVKRLHLGTQAGRVRKVIEKANKQIKRADPHGSGILFISLARGIYRATFDDRIPTDVRPYIEEVEQALGGNYFKSVGEAIVTWDDFMIHGDPPDFTMFTFRRRSHSVIHAAPRKVITPSDVISDIGATMIFAVQWLQAGLDEHRTLLPALYAGDVFVTQHFREVNEISDGVRAAYAIEVVEDPDAVEQYDLGGVTIILATRRITFGRKPYTLLVVAHRLESGPLEIDAGYRLYDDSPQDAMLAVHPFIAIETLLARYGVPVTVGDQTGLLIQKAELAVPDGDLTPVLAAQSSEGDPLIGHAFFRVIDGDPPILEVRWAFALLRNRYWEAVRNHRA